MNKRIVNLLRSAGLHKDIDPPPMNIIKQAVQMMDDPGAPTFATKHAKREATEDLARQLWKSEQ